MDIFDLEGIPTRTQSQGSAEIAPALLDAVPPMPDNDVPSPGTSIPRGHRAGHSLVLGVEDLVKHKKRGRVPEDFEQLKVLGTGAYGKVLLVRDKTSKRLYAQKQLKKATLVMESRRLEQTMSERQILEAIRHPYIVRLHYAVQDPEKLYLILQYAPGGELFTHLASERMFDEDIAAFYTAQIVSALTHLHKSGIVYRDLKPENCLLDADGNLLLTDFGLSKVAEDGGSCKSLLGTPEYMAPEVLLGKEYDYAVDWWALGAVLFDMLTGSPPFTGNNNKRIMEKITRQKVNLPYYLSEDAKDLLRKLLRKEAHKRLGFRDIQYIQKHRFFRKLNWKAIETKSETLDPPIKPLVTDPELAENFSDDFTKMILSPPTRNPAENHLFQGFSYVGSVDFIEHKH